MASPHSSEDENYGIDPSVPFKGVIVCCTDIPTDQRVRFDSPSSMLD
jgi:predicted nucleic acid-binding Zn ribbon protein